MNPENWRRAINQLGIATGVPVSVINLGSAVANLADADGILHKLAPVDFRNASALGRKQVDAGLTVLVETGWFELIEPTESDAADYPSYRLTYPVSAAGRDAA